MILSTNGTILLILHKSANAIELHNSGNKTEHKMPPGM